MNKEIYDVFEIFDIDKNRFIDRNDIEIGFKHFETNISSADLAKMINYTGKEAINLREFRKYLLEGDV